VESVGNVLCTWGLNHMVEELSRGTDAYDGQAYINVMAIATGTVAPASDDDALTGSTDTPATLSGASLVMSDGGARTLEARGTFDDAAAYTAGSVGLFGSNSAAASAVALNTFTEVSKQSADTINVTYQVIMGTA
jgi:hypothetical protein